MGQNMVTDLIEQIAEQLTTQQKQMSTAESCTGGLIAKYCTDRAGSSDWFDRGFVTYSNAAKQDMLGVSHSLIEGYGAVSEPVAVAMVRGALEHSLAQYAVAVTGVAGPSGGSDEKPVGTVWIAVAGPDQYRATRYRFDGDREAVREATAAQALSDLLALL